MKVHIIACGGAVMHNIALALHNNGFEVSGSDDEIFEPALSRLKNKGLLPEKFGWFSEKINSDLDFIILGMHAKADNPELLKAKEIGLKVYSFPDYIYQHAINKTRIVIAGSHGKTTTTAMVMHALKQNKYEFDYLVGSQLEGFDTMVKFSDAPFMVIEGDEYLTSPIDLVPKFLKYKPHVAMITGIAWDHINVFPTFELYLQQFQLFINTIGNENQLIYFNQDQHLTKLVENSSCKTTEYNTPSYKRDNFKTIIDYNGKNYELSIFGEHNLQNMAGAQLVCEKIGLNGDDFYKSMSSFNGTARRLEKVHESANELIYRDFAHSPSKLKATVKALREQFINEKLICVFELHTFSSLNSEFLKEYKNCLKDCDVAVVYFNPHVFEMKKMQAFTNEQIRAGFNQELTVISDSKKLIEEIENIRGNVMSEKCVYAYMSSGNFDNLKLW